MVRHVVAALTAMTIVAVEVGLAATVAATTTAIAVILATMIVSVAPTDVVTIMVLAGLTVMPPGAATIATAAVGMIIAEALSLTVEMVDDLLLTGTPLLGKLGTRMEVETKTTVLTIGPPVDRLRSANPLRCGALGQIMRPNLSATIAWVKVGIHDTWR